jgi:hypothetical protein
VIVAAPAVVYIVDLRVLSKNRSRCSGEKVEGVSFVDVDERSATPQASLEVSAAVYKGR